MIKEGDPVKNGKQLKSIIKFLGLELEIIKTWVEWKLR